MAAPTVGVGIDLGQPESGDFILDDGEAGVLDDSGYGLSSGFSALASSSVRVSITRGRWSRLTDDFDAASVSVVLNNEDRRFDPANIASSFYGALNPGRKLQITADDVPIITGWVEDWNIEYDVSGRSVVVAVGTDALGVLSRAEFDAWTSSSTKAGAKLFDSVSRSEVAWPSTMIDFDEGIETLSSDSVSWGSNVANYLKLVARSELGFLYSSALGVLTFRDRLTQVGMASSVTFADDGSGVAFQAIRADVGSDQLFSRVGVDREGGTNQTADVSDIDAWQTQYGRSRSLSISGLLLSTDAASLALAEYLLSLYDTPRYRVSELTVELAAIDSADQADVLALDIGSVVTVTFTPNGVGDAITQTLVVQGIKHEVIPASHQVTLSLLSVPIQYFRLDDNDLGVLDDDVLAF